MQELLKVLTASDGLLAGMSSGLAALIVIIVASLILLGFVAGFAGIASVVERKIAGRMQSRIGPNKVWFRGLFQFLADGIKLIEKEDIIPDQADKPLFKLSPYIVFAGMFAVWVSIPFGANLIAADLNIGIMYIFAISSLNVVGILMAGWASNNKWSLIGGIRGAAQIVSYEIPSGLSALTVILLAGTLSMQGIISAQGVYPWQWFFTTNPFATIAFFIMFTSLLAEGNRTPFDIPEAESELVSGYNTEYSGFRFVSFFFAEWANIYLISAILTTLFLGGWQSPWNWNIILVGQSVEVSGILIFMTKSFILSFVVMWLRWTLPRLRVDQLMDVCWKYLIPISFFNFIGVLLWMVFLPTAHIITGWIITGIFTLIFIIFMYRVIVINLIQMKAKIDFNYFR